MTSASNTHPAQEHHMPEQRLPDPFDGRPIAKTTVAIRNAGDGLSEALATDASTLHFGEVLQVVLEVVVAEAKIKPMDSDDLSRGPLVQAYVLKATKRATIMDDDMVRTALEAQEKRNDAARGRPQLPLDPDDDVEQTSPELQTV